MTEEEKVQKGKELLRLLHKGVNVTRELQELVKELSWEGRDKLFSSEK